MKKKTKKLIRKTVRAVTAEVADLAATPELRKVVVAGAVRWAGRRVLRKAAQAAAAGVAATAVAVPVGLYARRKLRSRFGKTAEGAA